MRIMSVVGARPQLVKLAPVSDMLRSTQVEHQIVHTGQHYDASMSKNFFQELRIPEPEINLGIGSGTHAAQTSAMLSALEVVFVDQKPDLVLVYGDTNSTLSAALCAVKLHLPVAHLEAGLRSFNRRMPEEHNRVLTDHLADLLLAPTTEAMRHLAKEGLEERAVLVGDVMVDVLLSTSEKLLADPIELPFDDRSDFVLATIHRAENTDEADRLASIIEGLSELNTRVVLAAHPRLARRCAEFGLRMRRGNIEPVEPLSYLQLVQALHQAKAVVTDSGGLQKEAYILGVPTTTVRTETEWVETLQGDWNVLVTDPRGLSNAVDRPIPTSNRGTPYGMGEAAREVVTALSLFLSGGVR